MKIESNQFIPLAQIALADPDLQTTVPVNTRKAYDKRQAAMYAHGFSYGEKLRQHAAEAKRRALRHLPQLLEEAEANMTANGIVVLWAQTAEEANQHIVDIAQKHAVRVVGKSKSMATEETALNSALEAAGIKVVETDLGEYIIQLSGERPSHIIAPIIHKTKAAIRDILVDKLGMPPTDDSQAMVAFARKILRDEFLGMDMGVSGGNFIIAESGSIALVTNEGNGRMVTNMARVHVALVGIEKVVATLQDYALLTQVLARSGTGQHMSVYTHIINGPRRPEDPDGPDHVYVVLLDNGRSRIYETDYSEVLACLRCGACQNACPVYRSTGGQAYGWVYGGPVGAVVTPLLVGIENALPLPHASSLCGSCKAVCPVDIDLPRLLLDLRHEQVERGLGERKITVGIRIWRAVNRSPRRFVWGGKLARIALRTKLDRLVPNPLAEWKQHRDFPDFAPKPFRQLWAERQQKRTGDAHG